jgi:hypothetical protein
VIPLGLREMFGSPRTFRQRPVCSPNFHSFISFDVHMTLPLIPKWEYWNVAGAEARLVSEGLAA